MTSRLLLDTSSLFYRAFFALPPTITDDEGMPVNAVRGYLDMTAHLTRTHLPDEVVHCIDDDWRPAARVEAYAGYKADRLPDPEGLAEQVPLLHEVLDAFGAVRTWAVGWEADDAIGTLCAAAGPDDRVDVVTGDRDLLQLVRDPVVRVLFTVKGVKELAVFDEPGVRAKYGVPPSRYVDFAILRGDPSDGLPGISGVGEKTARDLVRDFPSLEALVEGASRLSPRLAEKVAGASEYLTTMLQVVPVRTDLKLVSADGVRDDERVDALAERHRLDGPVGRLREALDAS
jgi:5'-3' exonuclease